LHEPLISASWLSQIFGGCLQTPSSRGKRAQCAGLEGNSLVPSDSESEPLTRIRFCQSNIIIFCFQFPHCLLMQKVWMYGCMVKGRQLAKRSRIFSYSWATLAWQRHGKIRIQIVYFPHTQYSYHPPSPFPSQSAFASAFGRNST